MRFNIAIQPSGRTLVANDGALPEDHWMGRTGLVHRAVIEDFPDLSGHQVHACGAPIMVESARADFIACSQLSEDEFFEDSFITEKDKASARAPTAID